MSAPGWYPDPGGRAGHYRLWDGEAWASSTTTDPPGGSAVSPPRATRPRGRGVRWLLAGGAVLVVVGVVTALALHPGAGPAAGRPPTQSAPTTALRQQECPRGNPLARWHHESDGRVHGGGLSFMAPGRWTPQRRAAKFSWAYDVGEADDPVGRDWFVEAAVGAVSVADGAEDVQAGAELMMSCTATPFNYVGVASRTDLVNQAATLAGYQAWTIRSEIRVDDPYTQVPGDVVQVTVVDLHARDSLAFFWGSAPLDDPSLVAQLDQITAGVEPG